MHESGRPLPEQYEVRRRWNEIRKGSAEVEEPVPGKYVGDRCRHGESQGAGFPGNGFLGRTQVGDAGVSQLNGLKHLSSLYLIETRVTDAGLNALADLPNLKCLTLNKTVVTSAGVEGLKRLPPRDIIFG